MFIQTRNTPIDVDRDWVPAVRVKGAVPRPLVFCFRILPGVG